MKENLTEMVFILDRSGSMHHLTSDTIGGFNGMIESQRNDGDAMVTTVLFDDQYELLHDHVDIKQIRPLTGKEYYVRGNTALLDAVGRTINMIEAKLSAMPESIRPDKVIFVITTDGLENASREFDKQTVRKLIERQQKEHSWTFMFLGANMDAVSEASDLGINPDFARTYTADQAGTQRVWGGVDHAMRSARRKDFDVNDRTTSAYMETMTALDEVEEPREGKAKRKWFKQ